MTLASALIRLCVAPVVALVTFKAYGLFYKHIGEPMWRRVLFGSRPYENLNPLNPEADRSIEAKRESARILSYLMALLAAAFVFAV